jgi:hypothetical protein
MEDVAFQNYNKYNISVAKDILNGTMIAINSSEAVGFALGLFYSIYNQNSTYDLEKKISLPMWDQESDGKFAFPVLFSNYNLTKLQI